MSKFKVGDRARIRPSYAGFGGAGLEVGDIVTITEVDRHKRYTHAGFHIEAKSATGVYDLFVEHELESFNEFLEGAYIAHDSAFVHTVESRQVWVTLPGDTAGHKLTEEEARQLFRELEAVV